MNAHLLLIWRHDGDVQKAVIKPKILHKSLEKTIKEGLTQTWGYKKTKIIIWGL